MPLQNRVDAFGKIHATVARGLFTGNRGVIHDSKSRTLLKRRWTTKAWIICDLVHPRGATRDVFGRNAPSGGAGWTELFFLDEVTALAAGHRPCFYCRRRHAKEFIGCFGDAFAIAEPKATEMDRRLHAERLASGGTAREMSEAEVRKLPDGAMIALGPKPFAIRSGKLLPWSFSGYGETPSTCRSLPSPAFLITPPTTVAVLKAGYRPVWHDSAGG
ncbi:MAG: hypothetical protein WDZ83_19595 [Rhizobiaceae bacterium]